MALIMNLKKFKFWSNDIIEFYCHPDYEDVIPEPKPAVKNFPEWFKKLEPLANERDNNTDYWAMTAKKCFPMIDAMSLGFTMPLMGDVHVRTNHNNSQIIATSHKHSYQVCEYHHHDQVGGHSGIIKNNGNPLKFINHWVIKTAPGWSTLFIPPINHFDAPFRCLGGLVDTDNYPKEVNFPAVWLVPDFDDHLYAGMPLVTAIPIKRNDFNKKPKIRKMRKSEMKEISTLQKKQTARLHYYTNELRVKK